eukprot:4706302-Amphidinium_carterae.1
MDSTTSLVSCLGAASTGSVKCPLRKCNNAAYAQSFYFNLASAVAARHWGSDDERHSAKSRNKTPQGTEVSTVTLLQWHTLLTICHTLSLSLAQRLHWACASTQLSGIALSNYNCCGEHSAESVRLSGHGHQLATDESLSCHCFLCFIGRRGPQEKVCHVRCPCANPLGSQSRYGGTCQG